MVSKKILIKYIIEKVPNNIKLKLGLFFFAQIIRMPNKHTLNAKIGAKEINFGLELPKPLINKVRIK